MVICPDCKEEIKNGEFWSHIAGIYEHDDLVDLVVQLTYKYEALMIKIRKMKQNIDDSTVPMKDQLLWFTRGQEQVLKSLLEVL